MADKGYEKHIIEIRFYTKETKRVEQIFKEGNAAEIEQKGNRFTIHLPPHASIIELFHEIGHYLERQVASTGIELKDHEIPFFLEDYAIKLIRTRLYQKR